MAFTDHREPDAKTNPTLKYNFTIIDLPNLGLQLIEYGWKDIDWSWIQTRDYSDTNRIQYIREVYGIKINLGSGHAMVSEGRIIIGRQVEVALKPWQVGTTQVLGDRFPYRRSKIRQVVLDWVWIMPWLEAKHWWQKQRQGMRIGRSHWMGIPASYLGTTHDCLRPMFCPDHVNLSIVPNLGDTNQQT